MLDIYDRLGVLVLDENRQFGDDRTGNHTLNMAALVKRDRNHPCVFAWSYCNEHGCDGTNGRWALLSTR